MKYPVTLWTVSNPNGVWYRFLSRPSRNECVAAFNFWSGRLNWNQARRKGYKCIKLNCYPASERSGPLPNGPLDAMLDEVIQLLNDNEYSEVLKTFRKHFGLVNRFVCNSCGRVDARITRICPDCGGSYNAKVVREKANARLDRSETAGRKDCHE